VKGGGNVGNALTAASRLGLNTRIFTKVANDGPGKQILDELQGDGIDTSNVVVRLLL
jgi:sugar/nucleoside kinase (ribokinase family)